MSPDNTRPGNISPTDKIGSIQPLGEDNKENHSPEGLSSFKSMMNEPTNQGLAKPSAVSPFQLVGAQMNTIGQPSLATLMTQVKTASTTMGDIQGQLNTPNLKLKQSQKYILKNKLSEANSHIRSANSKMGVGAYDAIGDEDDKPKSPFAKFLAFANDGQMQLQAAQDHLDKLKADGQDLNPADLLLVQIKMSKANQELEYTSVLLGKAMDDLKTIFNVQL